MKKIVSLILALTMLLGAGLAYATSASEDMTGEKGVIGEFPKPDEPEIQDKSVIIYKEITAYNPEKCDVNAPTITYNYTIVPATVAEGTKVTDNASRHKGENVNATVAVKAGIPTPTITGTAAGALAITPADQLKASANGTANRFPLTVDFSQINFTATPGTGAGVYRYEITETTSINDKKDAGIKDGNNAANDKLYMDVYVDGSGNIYGYTLFKNNVTIDGSTSEETASTTAGKVEGFVGDKKDKEEYASEDASVADKYYTFNFDVSKDVENDAYAETTHHQFPFSVTFANANVTVDVLPKVTPSDNNITITVPTAAGAIASFSYDGAAGTVTNDLKIADGSVVSFVGIPCGTTVTINEKNDVTGVTYKAVSTGAHTNVAAMALDTGDVSGDAVISCTQHIKNATENHTGTSKQVLFTNTLLQISPTGVVLRVAPYALILIGGILLLLISRKRRTTEK